MLERVRKTDLVLGVALGAVVGILVGAMAVAALYFSNPDLFEPFLHQFGFISR